MTIRIAALALLALTACRPGSAGEPQPGDRSHLTGSWDLVVQRPGAPDLVGELTLAPSAPGDATVPASLNGGTLEGSFHLQGNAWLTAAPVDSGASAFIDADSSVIVYLRLQGRCANCGNIGLAGKWTEGQVTGHWVQEFSSHPPQGSFTLRRVSGG